jgi:Arc/MetJ family transcription regulator
MNQKEEIKMRVSVELDKSLLEEVMRLTGESKMSTAVSKATELYVNRRRATEIVRSLREEPLNYEWTNEQVEQGEMAAQPIIFPATAQKSSKTRRHRDK